MRAVARLPAPHLLLGALCFGLALSLAARESSFWLAIAGAVLAGVALHVRDERALVLALAMVMVGWWLGSLRLQALDNSILDGEIGRISEARVEVTGPARNGLFATRVPVKVLRFGVLRLDERARLELPRGRAPPQGSVVEVVAAVKRPRGPEGGFDESSHLRRQGIHVVLAARDYRIVGHRGGLGGVADRLRTFVSRGLAPEVGGERRAVIAGIILGEDENLGPELQDSFRASGLYHLLRESGEAGTLASVSLGYADDGVVSWRT